MGKSPLYKWCAKPLFVKTYSDTINAVDTEVNRINWKLKTKNWQPILFLRNITVTRRSFLFTRLLIFVW